MKEVPVVISGGSSVGLSLAAELGWRGVKCLVVEQSDTLNPHPRANAVANRTMEYYRRWGIDQAITDAGVLLIILLTIIGYRASMVKNYTVCRYHHSKKLKKLMIKVFI